MPHPESFIPLKPRHGRKRRVAAPAPPPPPPPPAAPVLVGGSYDSGGPEVTLVFDRAINIDAFDGTQIVVDDQVDGWLLDGTGGATLINATTVLVALAQFAGSSGADVLLAAGSASGIVAVDGGVMWPGVSEVVLPFP